MGTRKKVDAKNGLEQYCFQVKNTLNDEKMADKFTADDKQAVEDLCKEGVQYLESNPDAEAKQKEIEAKFNPIMQRIYQSAGAPNGPTAESDARGQTNFQGAAPESNVEDLD